MNKILTMGEFDVISKRIDEINEIMDLCDDRFDYDIIENLHYELRQIEKILNNSMQLRKSVE